MSNLIYKTANQAKHAAKQDAISQAEKHFAITLSTSTSKRIEYTKDNWLLSGGSCQCQCGETPTEIVVLFYKGEQFTSGRGYCDSCGAKYPM